MRASVSRRFVTGWVALVTLPPTLLHEVAHCLAAAPVAERVALVVEPTHLHAESQIWWAGEPPAWVVRFVHLVPHLGGLVVGAVVAWAWVTGALATPATSGGLLVWVIAALWWVQFTAPSLQDLRGARAAGGEVDG